jgi:hypothetical protein
MLGIDASMIASGGWKPTRENVDKLILDLRELLGSLPPGTPIVLFCLDNSCFLSATEEGGMVPISRCVPGYSTFHVNGALVVAPERALQHAVDQLKWIRTCSLPPRSQDSFRYRAARTPAMLQTLANRIYLSNLISDLTKLKFQLRKKLQSATIIDGIELICGTDADGRRSSRSSGPVGLTIRSTRPATSMRKWPST